MPNVFLYGDLIEHVFMEQPLGYAVQGETTQLYISTILIFSQGLTPYEVDPTIYHTSTSIGCIILVVYVGDILVSRSNIAGITQVNAYLNQHLTI